MTSDPTIVERPPRGPNRTTIDAVVAAGLDLLVEEGVGALTPHRIHQRSGLARTTVYRHWPSPADVVRAIIDDLDLDDDPLPRHGDLLHDLEVAIDVLWRRVDQRAIRALLGALVLSGADDTADADSHHRRLVDVLVAPVADLIRAAQQSGAIVDGHVGVLTDELAAPAIYRFIALGLPPDRWHTRWMVTSFLAQRGSPRNPGGPSSWRHDHRS